MTAAADTGHSPRTTFARATAGYDAEFEQHLVDAITRTIFAESKIADADLVAIRTGETTSALLTVLAATLALSPSVTRSPTAIRHSLDELGKRLRRLVAQAERDGELQDLKARVFRGPDVDGSA